MMKTIGTLTITILILLQTQTFAAVADRYAILKRIQRACEKNIVVPKIRGDRVRLCECVVRNHQIMTKTEELPIVERIYSKSIQSDEPSTTTESVVADFDMSVAQECLKNPKFKVGQK